MLEYNTDNNNNQRLILNNNATCSPSGFVFWEMPGGPSATVVMGNLCPLYIANYYIDSHNYNTYDHYYSPLLAV